MNKELYVYLWDFTNGGGHKVRAEEWQFKTNGTIVNINDLNSTYTGYDTIYVDVKECFSVTGELLSKLCDNLIFIDDYGYSALEYAKKIIANIPHYNIPDDPRIEKRYITSDKIKRVNCYLYCGYADPHGLMLNYIDIIHHHYPVDTIYCMIGDGFTFEYIQKIRKIETVKIKQVALGDLSECRIAFCSWGLHYLDICQKIPTIPISWDDRTLKAVNYFMTEK